MPSCPGVFPVMAQAHAGTVMGGVMLARSPHIPRCISAWMFGVSASKSRNKSWGVPQSSPMTATRGVSIMSVPRRSVRIRVRQQEEPTRGSGRMLPTPHRR
jgi:hypothetical protein